MTPLRQRMREDMQLRGFAPVPENTHAATRAHLDEATWQVAWTEGQTMTLEQAIAYALREDT